MTKVKDIFPDIFTGVNVKNYETTTGNEYKYFDKSALQYGTLIETKLKDIILDLNNKKYVMADRDIIFSLKKPFVCASYKSRYHDDIVIPNNFAILRGIDMEKYSFIFITNYLNNIWLPKYMINHDSLSLEDIKLIDIPDIPKNKQMTITKLCEAINQRDNNFVELLDNDSIIIKKIIEEVAGE